MNLEIQEFGNNIIQNTYKKWKCYENRYEIWNYGFGVFYSPIYYKPDLMIIGSNPGGTNCDFSLSESLIIPEEHEYFKYDYKLARIQKEVWEKLNRINILKQSVKLNLNFFRSKSLTQWKTVPQLIRSELENFCIGKVKEIIGKISPKVILTEGIQTYDKLLMKVFNKQFISSDFEVKNKRMRIFTKSHVEDRIIIGVAHLSGCNLSSEDISAITYNLKNCF